MTEPRHAAGVPAPLHQTNSWYGLSAATGSWSRRWAERRGQRRALAELARVPHLLDDIGLTRAQALREAGKPFWQR